ncbi:MAG TPA: HAMP domain-containing sensor histidine kinase [Patescibacteria group bacterium]|nr:HAMP domain-containing sensor histidine kinase [Patescibacteria group bacterium]
MTEKIQDTDDVKSEFVALVSHQLRTPLSAIRWYSEMLMSGDAGELNDKQKKLVKEIYRGTKRMVELISALLDVSRIELGTFAVEPEETDLAEIAASSISELSPAILEKGLEISQQYDPGVPHVYMDPRHARIILQNLLTNAAKYTPTGGKISVHISKAEPDNVKIEIADTGYGIPTDAQDKVFTKLFRANNIKAKDTTGSGLGLYLVKQIMLHNGGEISFSSVLDQGTTFTILLPLQTKAPVRKGAPLSSFENPTEALS